MTVPPTEPAEQLRLVNVRRCLTSDGRAVHMLYTWHGAPLSVYVLQENAGRDSVVDQMGHEAAIWCANGRTYAIVADGHPSDLTHIVDYMKARVRYRHETTLDHCGGRRVVTWPAHATHAPRCAKRR